MPGVLITHMLKLVGINDTPDVLAETEKGKDGAWRWFARLEWDGSFLAGGHPNGYLTEEEAMDAARFVLEASWKFEEDDE